MKKYNVLQSLFVLFLIFPQFLHTKSKEVIRAQCIIEKIVGKKAVIEYTSGFAGDVSVTHADVSKAQQLIGYAPKTSVEEGMRKMYECYLKMYVLF